VVRIALFIGLVVSCGFSKRSQEYLTNSGVKITQSEHVKVGRHINEIKLQYLGCGGLFIKSKNQSIMIDPYFSHQPFMRIGKSILLKSKIKPSRKQIALGKQMIEDSLMLSNEALRDQVKGIFSAHGHYDHLMDVPFIHHEWLDEKAEVFMNSSSYLTCSNVISAEKLNNIERIAAVRNQSGDSVEFVDGTSRIRVYPIFADHNPHSRNIKLFAGGAVKAPTHFQKYDDKTFVNDWLEGQTLSFLIDILQEDSIQFRIFLQSSSCQFPNGIPPDELLSEKNVDLAILGVASYHFSENTYPCDFVTKLQPGKLMFIHWEDFFDNFGSKARAVKKNDIPRFINKFFSKCQMPYSMPVPGSVLTITY
jgi:hypothetical protein